jgi:hypothetical protein
VTHETLAVFLAIVAALIIAGLAWIVYLTRDIGAHGEGRGGHSLALEGENTRASLPSRER